MEVKHVSIEEATIDQLRWFAEVVLQLELPDRANGNHIKAAMAKAGWDMERPIFLNQKSDIYPDACDADGRGRPLVRRVEFNGEERDCVKIIIPVQDKAGGSEPVPVSVNGRAMWITRGKPVFVPVEYVEALENAEQFTYKPYDGNGLGGLPQPEIVKEYPFSYVA